MKTPMLDKIYGATVIAIAVGGFIMTWKIVIQSRFDFEMYVIAGMITILIACLVKVGLDILRGWR